MTQWAIDRYGEPCRECYFSWTLDVDAAIEIVCGAPEAVHALVENASGNERRADLEWNVTAYVAHVGDNLRIWAERLVSARDNAPLDVGRYDERLLSRARCYEDLRLTGVEWSLSRAVDDWRVATSSVADGVVLLVHPDRGALTLADVAVANAHDVCHHLHDIRTTLESA